MYYSTCTPKPRAGQHIQKEEYCSTSSRNSLSPTKSSRNAFSKKTSAYANLQRKKEMQYIQNRNDSIISNVAQRIPKHLEISITFIFHP
jgi:hypothetical protein